jgi:outer membrane protein OmpA-like peptidoglycan-associated protein/tetratricopeptide (TPR) repeat protein
MKYIKSGLVLAVMMWICTGAIAQSVAEANGDRNFKRFDFATAADNYKNAVAKAPTNLALKQKLARTYVLIDDHVNAEAMYAQIITMQGADPVNKLYYGLELRANGKYDEAARAFNEYAKAVPGDQRSVELGGGVDKMKSLAVDQKIFEVENLAAQNSADCDMGVSYYKDGIMFSSNRGTDKAVIHQDVWTSKRFFDLYTVRGDQNGSLFETAKIKGKQPDRKFHEGPSIVSADGKELFFTRSNYIKSKTKKDKNDAVVLKIMHADWDDVKQKWTNIKELNIDNDEYSIAHPALSHDGKRLFFVSDMPGGMGETDIYVSYRDANNNWGPAINLGKNVNTPGREMFPFLADDGTLYFSSDDRTGLGGLDVYSSTFASGEWGAVQNLGAPINTTADDFGFIINNKNTNGYFISNRSGGKGSDDIYKFKKNGVTICGTVVDAITKELIPGSAVKLENSDKVIGTKVTDNKGKFCFSALPNKNYKITATKAEYDPNSTSVFTGNANQVIQIPLSKPGNITLNVCVTQAGAGTLEGATVELTNQTTGEKKTCVITAECKCKFDLDPNTEYSICAFKEAPSSKGGYDRPCKKVSTIGKTAPSTIFEALELTYLEENMVFKIENLYYDLDKANIRPDAAIELNKVLAVMNKFPNMEIELSSHTDCRATMKYNDNLSARRAKACVDYLATNGIDPKRIIAVGYGERKLVNGCACEGNVKSNCTETQHQQNRRTEFKILKVK